MENEIKQINNLIEDYVSATKKLIRNRKKFNKLDLNIELNQMKGIIISVIDNDDLILLSMDLLNAVIYKNLLYLVYAQENENYEECSYIHNSLLGFYIDIFMYNITKEKGRTIEQLTELYDYFEKEGNEHMAESKHYAELMVLFENNDN